MNKKMKVFTWLLCLFVLGALTIFGLVYQKEYRKEYWFQRLKECNSGDYVEVLKEIKSLKVIRAIPLLVKHVERDLSSGQYWKIYKFESRKFYELKAVNERYKNGQRGADLILHPLALEVLKSLRISDPDRTRLKIEPYLKNESEIVKAIAASLLIEEIEDLKKYVSKTNWGGVWEDEGDGWSFTKYNPQSDEW